MAKNPTRTHTHTHIQRHKFQEAYFYCRALRSTLNYNSIRYESLAVVPRLLVRTRSSRHPIRQEFASLPYVMSIVCDAYHTSRGISLTKKTSIRNGTLLEWTFLPLPKFLHGTGWLMPCCFIKDRHRSKWCILDGCYKIARFAGSGLRKLSIMHRNFNLIACLFVRRKLLVCTV